MTILILMFSMIARFSPVHARHTEHIYRAKDANIAARLKLERTRITLGEPLYMSLAIENRSRRKLQIIVGDDSPILGTKWLLRLSATRQDGLKIVPPPPNTAIGGNAMVGPNDLPPGKTHQFERLLTNELKINEPGRYRISCRKVIRILRPGADGGWDQHQKPDEIDVEAKAELVILPADSAALGTTIEGLGHTAGAASVTDGRLQEAAWRAGIALSTIPDARVIPWFAKMLATRDSSSKSMALRALARFHSRAALDAIRSALTTTGKDIGDCTTAQLADQTAKQIREEATTILNSLTDTKQRQQ